jgi:hypothetical protein
VSGGGGLGEPSRLDVERNFIFADIRHVRSIRPVRTRCQRGFSLGDRVGFLLGAERVIAIADGARIVTTDDRTARLWNATSGRCCTNSRAPKL